MNERFDSDKESADQPFASHQDDGFYNQSNNIRGLGADTNVSKDVNQKNFSQNVDQHNLNSDTGSRFKKIHITENQKECKSSRKHVACAKSVNEQSITSRREISLSGTAKLKGKYVTNESIKSFKSQKKLKTLIFTPDTKITSLENAPKFPNLEELVLRDTNINTYKGLSKYKSLKRIDLVGTPLSKRPGFRIALLIAIGSSLTKINGGDVTIEERKEASNYPAICKELVDNNWDPTEKIPDKQTLISLLRAYGISSSSKKISSADLKPKINYYNKDDSKCPSYEYDKYAYDDELCKMLNEKFEKIGICLPADSNLTGRILDLVERFAEIGGSIFNCVVEQPGPMESDSEDFISPSQRSTPSIYKQSVDLGGGARSQSGTPDAGDPRNAHAPSGGSSPSKQFRQQYYYLDSPTFPSGSEQNYMGRNGSQGSYHYHEEEDFVFDNKQNTPKEAFALPGRSPKPGHIDDLSDISPLSVSRIGRLDSHNEVGLNYSIETADDQIVKEEDVFYSGSDVDTVECAIDGDYYTGQHKENDVNDAYMFEQVNKRMNEVDLGSDFNFDDMDEITGINVGNKSATVDSPEQVEIPQLMPESLADMQMDFSYMNEQEFAELQDLMPGLGMDPRSDTRTSALPAANSSKKHSGKGFNSAQNMFSAQSTGAVGEDPSLNSAVNDDAAKSQTARDLFSSKFTRTSDGESDLNSSKIDDKSEPFATRKRNSLPPTQIMAEESSISISKFGGVPELFTARDMLPNQSSRIADGEPAINNSKMDDISGLYTRTKRASYSSNTDYR